MSATSHAVPKLAVPARSPFPFLETFLESLSHASVHLIGGHRRRASEDAGAKFPVEQMLPLIITIMGICLNCRVRTKEITIEVILFEYSRTVGGRPLAVVGVTPDWGVFHIRHTAPKHPGSA